MQENITANVSEDTITLEFLRLDGVHVSQLVDFTNVSVLYWLNVIVTVLPYCVTFTNV